MCEPPVAPTGPAVAVHLRNDSDVDVFLPFSAHNGEGPPFELRDPDDNLQTIELVNGDCECTPGYSTSLMRIVLGGVYEGTWSGVKIMTLFTEEVCVPEESDAVWCEILDADFGENESPLDVEFMYPDTSEVTLSLK